MNLQRQQRLVIDALEDAKASDIRVFNTTGLSSLFDRVIIASGTSTRQTRSIAQHVVRLVTRHGLDVLALEGTDPGEWVLIDLGDIVVHCMQPAIRAYYNLEELWGAHPVRVKLLGDEAPAIGPSDPTPPDE